MPFLLFLSLAKREIQSRIDHLIHLLLGGFHIFTLGLKWTEAEGSFLLFCLRDESFCYLSEEEIDLNIRSRLECTTHSLPRVSTRGRLTNKRGLANDEEFQKAYSVDMADVTQEIE